MTCRDVSGLLPLFFDGELDSRQMRVVALHSARCTDCEGELRRFERLQELVSTVVAAEVEEMDLGQIWPAVEARLTFRVPWWLRLRLWWEARDLAWWMRVPALGAAIAAAAVALLLWSGHTTEAPQVAQAPAVVDNSATLDSLYSSAGAVAVLSEPETNTMVLWVNDDSGGEGLPP